MAAPQVGEIGLTVLVTVVDQNGAVINISAATAWFIYFLSPTNKLIRALATPVGGGTTGQMSYTTQAANELDQPGQWALQGRVIGTGYDYPTSVDFFTVLPNTY